MKQFLILTVLVGSLLLITSCGDDEEPSGGNGIEVLQLDGPNFTAPTFGEGFYEFAVRFTAVELSPYIGESLTEISFYLYDMPAFLNLTISPDFTLSEPGAIEYEQQVLSGNTNSWNTITLDEPYVIDGSPIWIGVQVELTELQQTVGCDEGPANANGDWLFDDLLGWLRFTDRTPESVNWNIRATVTDSN